MAKWRALIDAVLLPVPPAYFTEQRQSRHVRAMVMFVYIMVVYTGFYALDLIVYPKHALSFGLMRLFAVVLSAVSFFGFRHSFRVAYPLSVLAIAYATLTVVVMCVMTEGFGSHYVVGVVLCLVGGSTIELMSPGALLSFFAVVVAAYVGLNLVLDVDASSAEIASGCFFLIGGAVLCGAASFLLEHNARRLFLVRASLAEAHRQQKEFFGKITHELRTPVNSISGFTELLTASEQVSPAGKRKLDLIRKSAARLHRLIGDILDLAKHEAVGLVVQPVPVDVPELLTELRDTAVSIVGRRPVSVEVTCQSDVSLITDPARLRQILLNLTANAVKFTMEGSVRVSAENDQAQVRFVIEDTGLGIPLNKQQELFAAFTQARVDDQSSGTGLGLNIVRQFTELLHGRVSVESEEGHGSRFTVVLPARYEKVAS